MSAPEHDTPGGNGPLGPNSFGAITVIIEGEGEATNEPLPPIVKIWMDYERDRHANPTTRRPYRPFLEPPTAPPSDNGTT
jgi:hypothetical protein